MVVLALPVFRFVEPCEPSYPARVAGYDDLGIWHDPGNGQFAKPGWSTAKGLVLDMVGDLLNSAREHVRHAPEGRALTVKDSRLTGIGVGAGDNVRVRYLNDEFGIVDVRRSGERRPHLVPWSRFSDTIPDPSAPVVDNPEFVNAPAVHEESSGLVDRLAANGGVGFVEVVGNDLNRYGVAAGSVLEARLGDDGAVTVTTPDGTRFRVPSRLVEPSIAPPDTPRTTEPGSAPDDVSAPTGVHVDDRREDSVGVPDRPSTPDIEAEPDDVDEADGSEPLTPPTTPEPDDEPDVQAEPEPGPDPIQEPDKIDEIPDPDIDPDEPEIPDDEDDGEVPVPRVGTREAWIADAVADHGVTREQVLDAYRDITGLRAEMRRQARAAQVPLLQTIDRVDALKVARPPAKKPVKQADGRTVWTRGAGSGEWDWFDHLGKAERNRIRNKWMVATRDEESAQASYAPDQLQQNIELAGVSDDVSTVDGAMQWWLDQIRMIDGLGNIALGRSAFNMDALGIELDGVKPSDILGRDRWDAAGAVAAARAAAADRYSSEEADMASQYLAAAYRAPEGERPWEIGYVRWVAELDDYLDAADAYEQDGRPVPDDITERIEQLLPLGSDPDQSLEEAYAEIAEMAKAAGETVNPDLPGIPDAPAADAPSVDATTAPEQSATHAVATLFDRIHEKPTLEDKTEAEALADHIFAHDLGGGFSTKVTATNPNRSGGIDEMSLTVRGAIVAPDGRHVRSWQATITPENVNADTPLADQDPDIGVSFSRIDKGRGTIIDAALNSALSDAIRTAADDNGFGTDIEPAAAVAQAGEPVDLASLNPGDTFAASDIPGRWLMGSDGKVYGLNEDGTVTNGVLRDDVAAALSDREFTTAEPFEPAFPNAPELGTAFDGSNASVYASAVASGQVTLDELRDTLGMTEDQLRSVGRSGGGGGHEDVNNGSYGFAPLPEQMFHVTTAADSVLANGLKTASERQSGGTLGLGGSSDEISLASDVAHAEAIRDGILEAVDVAQGNITYDDMVRRAIDGDRGSQPFGDKFVAQMKYSLGLPDEWQPGDPIPETNGRDPLDLWKQFSLMRMNADGPRDPLVMTSADNLRRINPDQVQIMSVAPANDRAMGIPLNLGGTADDGEWRVPTGRALKVNGIADTPDTPDPGMFDATGYTVGAPDATPDAPAPDGMTDQFATGKVRPQLPADYDAKLWERRLADMNRESDPSAGPESLTAANEFQRPTKRLTPAAVGQMVANGEPLWHRSEVADDAQAMALLRTQVAVNMYDPAELSEDMDGPLGTLLWRENRGYKLSPDDVLMLGVARHEPEAVGRLFAKFRRQYEGKAANSKIPAEVELSADVRADAHAAWTETVTHPALVAAFDTIGVDPPNMILSRWREPWDDDRDANGTYTAGSNTVWINSTDFWGGISAGLSNEEARSFPISITERAPAAIGAATTSGGDRRGVMIHETGHYVHDHLAAAGGGFVGTPLADEWKQMWGAYHDAYIAATEAASGVPGGIAGLHRKQLSFYSHENFKEGFAETFGLVARGADPEGLDPEGRALFDWMSTNVFGLAPGESFADIEVGQTYSVNGVKIERTANGYVDVATGEPVNANGRPL